MSAQNHPDIPGLCFVSAEGRTGVPFVDANMRELSATGFMSNRGRQNVASFLTKDLGLDWRMGAEWFEYLLVRLSPLCTWSLMIGRRTALIYKKGYR